MKNVLASLERAAVTALGGLGSARREPLADRDGQRRCFPETAAPTEGCLPAAPAQDEGCFPGISRKR
jgi:hypothetical protein